MCSTDILIAFAVAAVTFCLTAMFMANPVSIDSYKGCVKFNTPEYCYNAFLKGSK